MPTPDGREWWNSRRIGERIILRLEEEGFEFPLLGGLRNRAVEVAGGAFSSVYGQELKINRLTEILARAVIDDGFDDSVAIRNAFKNIYNADFLKQFDEEGNILAPEEEE